MAKSLKGMMVAILATDMFEESELTEPRQALHDAGAETEIIAPKGPEIIAANHFDKSESYKVDRLLEDANPDNYDALLLPGGALNADQLRAIPEAQEFARHFDEMDKPIAVICHGPWLLVSARLMKGRTLTSFFTIADDMKNAGATWVDEETCRDGNWISSRKPDDIPAFNKAMIELFAEMHEKAADQPMGSPQPAFGEKLDSEE